MPPQPPQRSSDKAAGTHHSNKSSCLLKQMKQCTAAAHLLFEQHVEALVRRGEVWLALHREGSHAGAEGHRAALLELIGCSLDQILQRLVVDVLVAPIVPGIVVQVLAAGAGSKLQRKVESANMARKSASEVC